MISFVVPAYNEEELLPATIEALHVAARGAGVDYEIVVADDASTDATASVATAAGARVVTVENRQIAATRNAGARASTGEVIVFVDADTVVPKETLEAAMRALDRGAAGGGADVRWDGEVPLYAEVFLEVVVGTFRLVGLSGGCFIFCTRRAFEEVGGFDEHLFASEEIPFTHALGKVGDFVLLREPVVTSGRKFRELSASEVIGTLTRIVLGGRSGLADREGLDLWYRQREDGFESGKGG